MSKIGFLVAGWVLVIPAHCLLISCCWNCYCTDLDQVLGPNSGILDAGPTTSRLGPEIGPAQKIMILVSKRP